MKCYLTNGLAYLVRETSSDLANRLILLIFGIVNSEKKASVTSSAFALAEVSAHHNNVQGVAHAILEMNFFTFSKICIKLWQLGPRNRIISDSKFNDNELRRQ